MTPDEQEAQSHKYGNDIVILLPLKSGNIAVFNSARELCGFIEEPDKDFMEVVGFVWRAPALRIESYCSIEEENADELLKEAGL